MPEIFLVSDTHFGHTNILQFEAEKRPFKCIEEHDNTLISNWNKVVSKRDVVYHLGDVCLGNSKYYTKLHALNGIKKLILGNHDRFNQLQPYFHSFYGALRYDQSILTHIPVHPGQLSFRFKYNLHGHLHSNILSDRRYLNISIEHWNLSPVPYDMIREKLKCQN